MNKPYELVIPVNATDPLILMVRLHLPSVLPFSSAAPLIFLPPTYVIRGKVMFILGNVCLRGGGGQLPTLAWGGGVPRVGGGYLPWTGGGGCLSWLGGPTLAWGRGGGYLSGQGVPTLDGGRRVPTMAGWTYLGLGRGYLPWLGGGYLMIEQRDGTALNF